MKHFFGNTYQSVLLALLWLSGTIKPFLNTYVIDIDITQLMLVIVLADIAISFSLEKLQENQYALKVFYLILIIFGWVICTTIFSPSIDYKFEKATNFTANIIYFLYPIFIRRINFNAIIPTYFIFFVPIALFYVYMMSKIWTSNSLSVQGFMDLRNSYLAIGFHLGLLFLMLNYLSKKIWMQVLVFGLLVACSARGPLILAVFVFIIMNWKRFTLQTEPKTLARIGVAGLGIVIFLAIFAGKIIPLFDATIRRFTSLTSGEDVSSETRFEMMQFAFLQPFENGESLSTLLFGNGFGSFGILYNGVDARLYPHNLFLEVLFELGLVGVILFIALFVMVLRKLSFQHKLNTFSVLFLFAFFNAMKSSGITDLWVLFSLMAGVTLSLKSLSFSTSKDVN